MRPVAVIVATLLALVSAQAKDNFTQTLQLHEGWNLVSWHIWPSGQVGIYQTIAEMLPNDGSQGEHSWFHYDPGGKVYYYLKSQLDWPGYPLIGNQFWNVHWAYYFNMNGPHNWNEYINMPEVWTYSTGFDVEPSDAWDDQSHNTSSPYARYWFFMGYAAPGYCKLASVPEGDYTSSGDPANFSYEGPFHWLIWDEATYEPYELKIVKTDDGRVYIPYPNPNQEVPPYDNIGVLEPGRGYFLGFANEGSFPFEGWSNWPQWQNENFLPPDPKGDNAKTASANHFQFNPYTHWSYPVYIDTVDQSQCPMESGDEIGVFDGDRCVGAAVYQGEFPLIVVCWQDDKATPMEVDGYIPLNPMTFIWYDQSENAEIEFQLPPMTQALQDDPVAPTFSGFGCGLYGRRSFMGGVAAVNQLPQEYKLKQNYPNPFNAETIIPLELPQRSKVKLEIFNVQGQRLGVPYERIYDSGWPKIRWNASKLPSGVYFCRITAEGLERGGMFTDVGKMLLLK